MGLLATLSEAEELLVGSGGGWHAFGNQYGSVGVGGWPFHTEELTILVCLFFLLFVFVLERERDCGMKEIKK